MTANPTPKANQLSNVPEETLDELREGEDQTSEDRSRNRRNATNHTGDEEGAPTSAWRTMRH